jgi:phosphate starvation-inducible PhoH-like protein
LTDTIINLETVNPIEFFGVNNGKLDLLKKKFPLLKILSRGTQIKLSGAPEQIETAKEKIDLILQYLERNGHLSENYFEQILGGDDAEAIDNFVDRNPNDILVFGPNGKTVRARTANQKKWYKPQIETTFYLPSALQVQVKHTPQSLWPFVHLKIK